MMSRTWIIFTFFICQFTAFGQLKKSYYGKYEGTIPSYEIGTGTADKIEVSEVKINIQLTSKELLMDIGTSTFKGTWKLLFEAKAYFVIEGKMDDQSAPERIIIYKKGKKISREGLRPQPDGMLKKVKQ